MKHDTMLKTKNGGFSLVELLLYLRCHLWQKQAREIILK